MILHFLDGGMLFEINKTYKDFGEYALINDNNLIDNLYKNYIDNGSKFITTCNYCLKPSYTNDWDKLTQKSVDTIQKFRTNNIKVFGSLPPFGKSYNNNKIDNVFINYYTRVANIFKNKVDFYIIETGFNYFEIKKIYDIIKSVDKDGYIIISLYPNNNHDNYIDEYLQLNLYGLFLNCCSVKHMKDFYNQHLKNKNFNKIKFGFYCNKIHEDEYAKDTTNSLIVEKQNNLQKYYSHNLSDEDEIKEFISKLSYNEIYIGGCCGYGVKEMKNLIDKLKK